MTPPAPQARPPLQCPRCRYDVSGPVSEWDAARECPMHGQCPECGHVFAWGDVFIPDRHEVAGFIEHVTPSKDKSWLARRWEMLRSLVRTWGWVLLVRRFADRVRVDHRVVPRRIVLGALLLVLMLHAMASTLSMIRVLILPSTTPWVVQGVVPVRRFIPTPPPAPTPAPQAPGTPTPQGVAAQQAPTFWLNDPTLLLDIATVWTYPFVYFQPTVGQGPGGVGIIKVWPLTPIPRNDQFPPWIFFALGMHLTMVALIVALGASRSGARVHSGHVLRAAVYGLAWVPLLVVFRLTRNIVLLGQVIASPPQLGALAPGPQPFRVTDINPWLLGIALATWTAAWWWMLIVRHWRLQSGTIVWLMLTIAALLAGTLWAAWDDVWMAWQWHGAHRR